MGSETTKALQARRRESAAKIDRLIARAEERSPRSSARLVRITQAVRLANQKTRALTTAQDLVAALELEIGLALLGLEAHGMSRNEAFALLGLKRHLGRRYVALAMGSQPAPSGRLSTEITTQGLARTGESDGESTTVPDSGAPGRNF